MPVGLLREFRSRTRHDLRRLELSANREFYLTLPAALGFTCRAKGNGQPIPTGARGINMEPMTQRIETGQWVPFPVELVFAFFATPSNLPHLMPPRMKGRIEDVRMQPPPPRPVASDPARRFLSVAAGEGSEILISFCPVSWLPQRVSWMARIVDFEWNSHFVDEQVRGPFAKFRHRHGIAAEIPCRWRNFANRTEEH